MATACNQVNNRQRRTPCDRCLPDLPSVASTVVVNQQNVVPAAIVRVVHEIVSVALGDALQSVFSFVVADTAVVPFLTDRRTLDLLYGLVGRLRSKERRAASRIGAVVQAGAKTTHSSLKLLRTVDAVRTQPLLTKQVAIQ